MFKFLLLIILFGLYSTYVPAQAILKSQEYENIKKFRKLGKDNAQTLDERLKFAKQAVQLSREIGVDSVLLSSNRILSTAYLYTGDYDAFNAINHRNLKLSTRLRDTLAIGIANHNLGIVQSLEMQNDSAYFYYTNAIKNYEKVDAVKRKIEVMANLSLIQYMERDYFGSEELSISALRLLEGFPLKEKNAYLLWLFYNRLGIISLDLGLYDKSLEYHNKALAISDKNKNGQYDYYTSVHNKAFVLRKQGHFREALALYNEILKQKDLFIEDPSFYPLILDNIAFTKFEAQDTDYRVMEDMFLKAYQLSDSLEDPITKLAICIDLSKFYKGQGKNELALQYAQESYNISKSISANDMLLESMVLLSDLNSGDVGKTFLKEHIKLSDSLLAHERGIRNKFARVQFDTDQIQLENEKMATEKMWWTIGSIVLLLSFIMLYIIVAQRTKNKELKFKQGQQKANEDIYNLMLSQQDKVDGARAEEKRRISQELHDGVLGRLFGTRLSLDSYNFNEGKEGVQARSKYISELQIIENDIRKISHDLNTDFVSGSGFMDILAELIEKQTQAYKFTYVFDFSDDINWEIVSNKSKINIYRIVQEALQNSYKHAKAKEVKICLELKKDVIWMAITDNGAGFTFHKNKKGIGLKNINSRVNDLNGTVSFQSELNKGTTILIKIPYII